MSNIQIIKRLYKDYTKNFVPKILLSIFFSLIVAASTASIAWLLDPAIKKIFIDKDQSLIYLIPLAIILAFSLKGISQNFGLYSRQEQFFAYPETRPGLHLNLAYGEESGVFSQ